MVRLHPRRAEQLPLTLLVFRKGQVKIIDESEDLKPEALAQMKRELKLLQGKVLASIEKELQTASDTGEEEREKVFAEANELITCIDADARRLHGDSAKVIGSAEEMMGEHEMAWCVRVRSSEAEVLSRAPRNMHR